MKNFRREMEKMKGISEMRILLRRSNVENSYGKKLLEIAIMSYLKKPSQTEEDLLKVVVKNAPMPIKGKEKERLKKACALMQEALQTLNTKKIEKLQDKEVVFETIRSVATEVRIGEALKYYEVEGELTLSSEAREWLTMLCKRRYYKPADTFNEVLNYVSGKYDLEAEELQDCLQETITEESEQLEDFVKKVLVKKDEIDF